MTTPILTISGHRAPRHTMRVTRGVHLPAPTFEDPVARLQAWQAVLPPQARFTHLTGAACHGLWLPPTPADLPIWVDLPYGAPVPVRPGLRVVRRARAPRPVDVHGLRLDPAADCVLVAARDLHQLDLTCLLDSCLQLPGAADRLADLSSHLVPGIPRFRSALAVADARSESILETLLRRLHQVCDVEVVPQHEVYEDGEFIARGDVWLTGTRRLHEPDGGHHLQRRQQRTDLRRGRRLLAVGWERVGYTAEDILHHGVGILRDADQALGREHDPSRIRAWHALLRDSLYSPAGTARLRNRLRLA